MNENTGFHSRCPGPGVPGLEPAVDDGIESEAPSLWRRLLACNPFYLVSAALLLFGLNRISNTPDFFQAELGGLVFNFLSIQFYEVLLVVTAVLLMRRRVWYDSTLLVCLENLFVFVPFILISQSSFIGSEVAEYSIGSNWMWGFSAAGGMLAVMRYGGLKRFAPMFNLPGRALGFGAIFLAFNLALPVVFRHLHETKVGTKPTEGAAFEMHEWSWLLILPALAALLMLLPRPRATGALLPQRGGWPFWWALMWTGVSGVHLYALGYVYDFDLRLELLAPGVWVLCWTFFRRMDDIFPEAPGMLRRSAMALPALVVWLAFAAPGRTLLIALASLNGLIFAAILWRDRSDRLALHLLLFSIVSVLSVLPQAAGQLLRVDYSNGNWLVLGAAAYALLCAAMSRRAGLTVLGAVIAGLIPFLWQGPGLQPLHWAIQSALVFFLLHSFRWQRADRLEVSLARGIAAAGWVLHSQAWAHAGGGWLPLMMIGLVVLAICCLARLLSGEWVSWTIPAAALLVALAVPLKHGTIKLADIPSGMVAILVSFVLFAMGTALAWTKHRWHKEAVSSQENDTAAS